MGNVFSMNSNVNNDIQFLIDHIHKLVDQRNFVGVAIVPFGPASTTTSSTSEAAGPRYSSGSAERDQKDEQLREESHGEEEQEEQEEEEEGGGCANAKSSTENVKSHATDK
jgi:hypothetical protein